MTKLSKVKVELKQMLPIAGPAILSQLAQMAMGVIDTIMSGHHSNEALAAIAIGTSLLSPVMVFFMGLFLAFNPIIAHFKGAKIDAKIASHFRLSLALAIIFSPIAIIFLLKSKFMLAYFGINEQILPIATGYLNAVAWGIPGLFLFLGLRFCNEGLFSTTAIMLVTLSAIPANIILNYWFMYGGWGIKPMGAVGLGYATSLIWTFMFFGLLGYTCLAGKYKSLSLFKTRRLPPWNETKDVLKLGFPMAVTLGFEISLFAAVALLIAKYPTEIMGAHQIAINIASVTFMIPLGMSQAIAARVSYFAGQKNFAASKLAGHVGIATSLLFATLSASIMVLFSELLISLYTQDKQVIETAITLLFYAAIFQFSDGLQVTAAGALRGLKDSKIPMVITAIAYWLIGFPLGFYLAENQNYNVDGYWCGLIMGLTAAAILLLKRWLKLSSNVLLANSKN